MFKFFKSAANARGIEKVLVFTNDNSTGSLAESLGIDSYMIDIETDTEKSELLPPGAYASVKYLQESSKLNFEDLMILNFRNPLLTPALIDEPINKFKLSKTPALISVKKPIDHPVQLNAYYRIVDVSFIHIFDDDEAITSYLQLLDDHISTKQSLNQRNPWPRPVFREQYTEQAPEILQCQKLIPGKSRQGGQCNPHNLRYSNQRLTKPFYFDWNSRGIQEKKGTGMYIQTYDDLSMKYIPVDQVSDAIFDEISSALWIHDGSYKARILFRLNSHEKLCSEISRLDKNLQLAGVAFSDDSNHISSLLFKDFKGSQYLLAINSENFLSHSYVLRVLPVRLSGPLENNLLEFEIDDFSKPIPFQYEDKDLCGMVYSLFKVAEDDTYDLCEPFPPDERLWTGSIQKINVKTGKEIMGRQDFPDVFEPERTFFIMRKDLIPSFDKEILNGNVDGFVMGETNSIRINSELDLLRYRASKEQVITV